MFTVKKVLSFFSFLRENRVRQYLGVRYDARSGVFDWDYHMKLSDKVINLSSSLSNSTLGAYTSSSIEKDNTPCQLPHWGCNFDIRVNTFVINMLR